MGSAPDRRHHIIPCDRKLPSDKRPRPGQHHSAAAGTRQLDHSRLDAGTRGVADGQSVHRGTELGARIQRIRARQSQPVRNVLWTSQDQRVPLPSSLAHGRIDRPNVRGAASPHHGQQRRRAYVATGGSALARHAESAVGQFRTSAHGATRPHRDDALSHSGCVSRAVILARAQPMGFVRSRSLRETLSGAATQPDHRRVQGTRA
mmetsp:Transcript_5892/g.17611  ORF Transcript_5892/g.17611 Transcript_5892/m.17611 type:complete len:205 (-) Transcript_5892:829-1443(-)